MWACKNESSCSLGNSSHRQCLEHSGTSELPLVATSTSLFLTCLPLEEHCVMNYPPQKRKEKRKKKILHRGPANTDVFSPLKLKCELFSFLGISLAAETHCALLKGNLVYFGGFMQMDRKVCGFRKLHIGGENEKENLPGQVS